MTLRTGRRSHFQDWLARHGVTWKDAAACIVSEDGDSITVDRDHPAFPRPAPTPPSAHHAEARRRWRWLHKTLAKPIAVEDRPGIEADILKLGDGLGCTCGEDFRRKIARRPIDWNDPEQWAVDIHNDVNRDTGKRCDWTVGQARAEFIATRTAPSA